MKSSFTSYIRPPAGSQKLSKVGFSRSSSGVRGYLVEFIPKSMVYAAEYISSSLRKCLIPCL